MNKDNYIAMFQCLDVLHSCHVQERGVSHAQPITGFLPA